MTTIRPKIQQQTLRPVMARSYNIGTVITPAGPVELRKNDTHIQYKLVDSDTWINLVSLSDIKGVDGQGVPVGGNTHEILRKKSTGDFHTEWFTLLDTNGKILGDLIPALKSHETVQVANATARKALTDSEVQPGDECIETSTGKTYKLVASDPSLDASWVAIADISPEMSSVVGLIAALAAKANDSEVMKLTGNQTIAGNKTFSSPLTFSMTSGKILNVGDDAEIHDVNAANTAGIIGKQDNAKGAIQLGNNGNQRIYGANGKIGIGTHNPQKKLHVLGETRIETEADVFAEEKVLPARNGTNGVSFSEFNNTTAGWINRFSRAFWGYRRNTQNQNVSHDDFFSYGYDSYASLSDRTGVKKYFHFSANKFTINSDGVTLTGTPKINNQILGDTGRITPTMLNGWTTYANDRSTPAYRRVGDIVYVRGMVKGGTTGIMFYLPVGMRPTKKTLITGTRYGNVSYRIDIDPSGYVSSSETGPSQEWFSIEFSFMIG